MCLMHRIKYPDAFLSNMPISRELPTFTCYRSEVMYQLCKSGWRGLTTWKIPILRYLYTFWMQVRFKLTVYWKYFYLLRSKTHNTTAHKNSKINRPAYINLTGTDLYSVWDLAKKNPGELKDRTKEFLWQLINGLIFISVSLKEAHIRRPSRVNSGFAEPMPIPWSKQGHRYIIKPSLNGTSPLKLSLVSGVSTGTTAVCWPCTTHSTGSFVFQFRLIIITRCCRSSCEDVIDVIHLD